MLQDWSSAEAYDRAVGKWFDSPIVTEGSDKFRKTIQNMGYSSAVNAVGIRETT
jgi:hypothetical protein